MLYLVTLGVRDVIQPVSVKSAASVSYRGARRWCGDRKSYACHVPFSQTMFCSAQNA